MRAYIDLKTNIPDLRVDYVEIKDRSGKVHNFNPNNMSSWDLDNGHFTAEWRGVDIGEEDATGQISELPLNCKICAVGANFDLDAESPYIKHLMFTLADSIGVFPIMRTYRILNATPFIERT